MRSTPMRCRRWRRSRCSGPRRAAQLAPYERAELLREMALMPEWFLGRHLELSLGPRRRPCCEATFEFLIAEALAQPAGVRAPRLPLAQPACSPGAPTPASSTSRTRCAGRSATTWCRCSRTATSPGRASAWCGWVMRLPRAAAGGGRHRWPGPTRRSSCAGSTSSACSVTSRCSASSARLWYRDGKAGYLQDLERTLGYVRETCAALSGACCLRGASRARRGRSARARQRRSARGGAARHDSRHGARGRARRAAAAPHRLGAEAPDRRSAASPLIAWHLAALRRAGVTQVVVNLSWLGEQLRAALGDGRSFGLAAALHGRGPGGARDRWRDPQCAAAARACALSRGERGYLHGPGLRQLHLEPGALAHLVLVPNPAHHPRGDFALGAMSWSSEGERLTYGNVGLLPPRVLRWLHARAASRSWRP